MRGLVCAVGRRDLQVYSFAHDPPSEPVLLLEEADAGLGKASREVEGGGEPRKTAPEDGDVLRGHACSQAMSCAAMRLRKGSKLGQT